MALLEGKTSTERNKLIAAAILGLVTLVALYMAFGRGLFSSSTPSAATKTSPTPKPGALPGTSRAANLPSPDEETFTRETTQVVYNPGSGYAPDPGRNIFAFYQPSAPCPTCPTPVKPTPTPVPITPAPTPVIFVAFVNPQSVYAGSKGFRLELNGERFTPDAHIYFSQSELPTTFINTQKVVADIPANFIAQEGPRQIIVQTPDGKSYSNQVMLNVQAPPKPGFQYIGMIGRKRYNNDTAYFLETGKTTPFGARLNDVVGGRFRLVDISPGETVFEDVSLGFRHTVQITKASATTSSTGQPPRPGIPNDGFQQFPTVINPNDCPPGIPCNIPRAVPPQPGHTPATKKDVDDDDDGDGGGK